jgi:hypothetical protein
MAYESTPEWQRTDAELPPLLLVRLYRRAVPRSQSVRSRLQQLRRTSRRAGASGGCKPGAAVMQDPTMQR